MMQNLSSTSSFSFVLTLAGLGHVIITRAELLTTLEPRITRRHKSDIEYGREAGRKTVQGS